MKENNLIIWYYRNILPVGIPHKDDIILYDSYNVEKNKFCSVSEWREVVYTPMPFPPVKDKYKLPEKLFCVLKKKQKEILFDYYDYGSGLKFVSEKFLLFIQASGMIAGYETAELKIVNKNNELITDRKYFLLRYGIYDDVLFNIAEATKQRGKHSFGSTYYTYPELELKDYSIKKSVFTLNSLAYRSSFIFKSELKNALLSQFYKPDIYYVNDFPFIYDHQYNDTLLPLNNNYKIQL